MKTYLVNGLYHATQADAKATAKLLGLKFDPERDTVEVPTQKDELIAFINSLVASDPRAEDPDRVVKDINEDIDPALAPLQAKVDARLEMLGYGETSLKLDELFANAPLAHRLTLASLALEDVRDAIPLLAIHANDPVETEPGGPDEEVDPFA